WIKGKYNYIFRKLNNLQIGDKIIIKATQKNGRSFEYTYTVYNKDVVLADDDKIFAINKNPTITLVTCWPLGTNWKRLIVKANLGNTINSN
ncbi:MAG TPA: sortase, partial [Candidatus Moranbacteria bacterium]|nr:sortase [Candidatus Moranbacteria bacterium]